MIQRISKDTSTKCIEPHRPPCLFRRLFPICLKSCREIECSRKEKWESGRPKSQTACFRSRPFNQNPGSSYSFSPCFWSWEPGITWWWTRISPPPPQSTLTTGGPTCTANQGPWLPQEPNEDENSSQVSCAKLMHRTGTGAIFLTKVGERVQTLALVEWLTICCWAELTLRPAKHHKNVSKGSA